MRLALLLIILLSLAGFSLAVTFIPPVTPQTPPDIPEDAQLLSPPTAPATQEFPSLSPPQKLLNLGYRGELAGFCQLNGSAGESLINLWGTLFNLRFDDPWYLGRQLGLAEDALEFRLGSGFVLASNPTNGQQLSIPCLAAARLYLKEGLFFGLDPFVGLGVNFNLEGFPAGLDRAGGTILGGFFYNVGQPENKVAISLGYNSYRINGDNYAVGWLFSVGQPVGL